MKPLHFTSIGGACFRAQRSSTELEAKLTAICDEAMKQIEAARACLAEDLEVDIDRIHFTADKEYDSFMAVQVLFDGKPLEDSPAITHDPLTVRGFDDFIGWLCQLYWVAARDGRFDD